MMDTCHLCGRDMASVVGGAANVTSTGQPWCGCGKEKKMPERQDGATVDTPNVYYDINDLPMSDEHRRIVLCWFARKIWVILEESSGKPYYYGKSYDPLYLEDNTAHSYVFELEDGGRHHAFRDLAHLEQMLVNEAIGRIKAQLPEQEARHDERAG